MALVDREGERISSGDIRQPDETICDSAHEPGIDPVRGVLEIARVTEYGFNPAGAARIAAWRHASEVADLYRPCKQRKDGAPRFVNGKQNQNLKGWATRPVSHASASLMLSVGEADEGVRLYTK